MIPALDNTLRNIGSAAFNHEPVQSLNSYEDILLSTNLAPWESARRGDEAEWHLF